MTKNIMIVDDAAFMEDSYEKPSDVLHHLIETIEGIANSPDDIDFVK